MPTTILKKKSGPTDGSATDKSLGWKVVLWNCDCHSFEHVERLLMTATRCGRDQAAALALLIHNNGKGVVFSGHKERCELAASILQDGGLRVTLEK